MTVTIRPFRPEDYPAVLEVHNIVNPEYPDTVEEWQFWDERREPHHKAGRWVAENGDQIVGFIQYHQPPWMYHPLKFQFGGNVLPDWHGQGIGTRLYDQLIEELDGMGALVLRVQVREDQQRGLEFLSKRGYGEEMRVWESRLDVAAFDPAPFAGAEDRPAAHGVEIKTVRELESDPERDRKLHRLENKLSEDVPSPDQATEISFEQFRSTRIENPDLLPDAFFVAVHNGEYVGLSALWNSQASTDLYTGLTGVLREYRRHGIALALKLRGIAYARERGTPSIKTWNASINRPMLSINERLGYVKQPPWIHLVKTLREEN